jgi:hypothetical protein
MLTNSNYTLYTTGSQSGLIRKLNTTFESGCWRTTSTHKHVGHQPLTGSTPITDKMRVITHLCSLA